MLPNDDFKQQVVEGEPMPFSLPINFVGRQVWNGPLLWTRVAVSFSTVQVDNAFGAVRADITNAYEVELTEYRVYDEIVLWDIEFGDAFYRRIHLFGFIRASASGDRINFERFVVPQDNTFELVVHMLDDAAKEMDLSGVSDAYWRLRDSSGTLQVTKQLTVSSGITISGRLLYIPISSTDLADLVGIYQHEFEVLFSDGVIYTLFHGDVEIKRGTV